MKPVRAFLFLVVSVFFLFLGGSLHPVWGATPAAVSIQNFSPRKYGAKKQNWSIVQDNRGIMYFANSAGVLEFDAVEWRYLPLPGGSGAYALAKDPQGRIYAGGEREIGYLTADDSGRMRYHSLLHKIPPSDRGLGGRVVQAGFIPGGTVFLFERLLVILEGEQTRVFKAEDHFYTIIYACGSLYVIDDTRGLQQYSGGRLVDVPGGGLLRAYVMLPFRGDKILVLTTQEGPLVFDPRDKQNPFTPFSTRPADFFTGNLVSCGIILENQSIVLGSVEKGIAVFDPKGNQLEYLRESEGLQDKHVYSLYRDSEGDLWAGLDRGISLLSSALFTGDKVSVGAAPVGDLGGHPPIPFAALIRSCRRSADDSFIFGGAYYIPGNRIQSFRQERHQIPAFDYAFNGFRFTFGCNHYRGITKTMYSCYLEGLDKGWSNWTERSSKEYTNLGWGQYTLRVRAKKDSGEISREAAYTFRVKPPWYETFWFLAGQMIFIIMLLVVSHLLEGAGVAPQMSQKLVIFAVVIIFEYVNGFIGPIIGRYSDGIAFFGMIMTGVLSFIISPAQELVTNILNRLARGTGRS
jgi:hypothetical protein